MTALGGHRPPPQILEDDLRRQLDHPGICSARYGAEVRLAHQLVVGYRELGGPDRSRARQVEAIKEIERFKDELQLRILAELDVARDSRIKTPGCRQAERVAADA